jgi:hypothetical protein
MPYTKHYLDNVFFYILQFLHEHLKGQSHEMSFLIVCIGQLHLDLYSSVRSKPKLCVP